MTNSRFSTIMLTYSHKNVHFLALFQLDYNTLQVSNSVFLIKIKEGNGIMERIKEMRLEQWLKESRSCATLTEAKLLPNNTLWANNCLSLLLPGTGYSSGLCR